MSTIPLAVEMRGITKKFPGVLANDSVNLEIRAGEIHALLGENGAGKSTLMNTLAGLYQPEAGEIWLHGKEVTIRSPNDAIRLGVGMVHQHFKLVETQTVAENVILGLKEPAFRLDMKRTAKELLELGARYKMTVDPNAYIWQLSVGEQQRVEILKMLYRNADILILDEPTAVLTPQETDKLFAILRNMRNFDFSHLYTEQFELLEDISTRDRTAIQKSFSGLMKILYPHREATPQEVEELGRDWRFAAAATSPQPPGHRQQCPRRRRDRR